MGQTGHGQICRNLKGDTCTSKYKADSKVSKINTDLIGYGPKTLVKKISKKKSQTCCYYFQQYSAFNSSNQKLNIKYTQQ